MAVNQFPQHYELKRRLGEGASAVVYEAVELRSGRVVAMKILRDELLSDASALRHFHREARALMCVAHPNVAAVYDYSGPEASSAFIAMELYDGQSLHAIVAENGRLPDAQVASIFVQVFAALEAAHAQNLLHRDLSTSNIIVTKSGRAIVTDFGLVAAVSGARTSETFVTRAASLVGTPLYYAPDLLLTGQYSTGTDLYAAGMCMTYALLGRAPYDTSNIHELLAAVIDGKLERVIPSGVTVDLPLATLADALTSPKARQRPSSARVVMTELETWMRSRSVAPRQIQQPQPKDEASAIRAESHGRFEIADLLGTGGMSRVFRARDKRLGRSVAIKLMLEDSDDVSRMRFHREARALGRIRHPNVIEVIDYSGPGGRLPYIVLELIEGPTLEHLVANEPVSEVAALSITLSVSEALGAVHAEGFQHRDVKPDNIFVDRTGRVVLADFGIVRSVRDETTGTFVSSGTAAIGTPLFASPEQILNPDAAGPASDLFSLGSLLYFLIAHEPPLNDGSLMDVLSDLGRANMKQLPQSAARDVRDLVRSLHQFDPQQRPASAMEVASRLRVMLAARKVIDPGAELRRVAGAEVLAAPTAVDRPTMALAKTSPAWPIFAAAAGLLVMAVVGALLLLRPQARVVPAEPASAPTTKAEPLPELPSPAQAKPTVKEQPKVRVGKEPALLRFFTKPWAKISIGDRIYGTTPMFNALELPPGRYVVRFENPSYRTAEKSLDLKSGERRELHVTLEKP